MFPDITFGFLLTPEGGNTGPIVLNPAIPHASAGFSIQWADLNFSTVAAGAYTDVVYITDDNNSNVQVWNHTVSVSGLGAGLSIAHVVNVPPNAIAPGTYTFHVHLNAWWPPNPSVFESNVLNNYTFNGNISVGT